MLASLILAAALAASGEAAAPPSPAPAAATAPDPNRTGVPTTAAAAPSTPVQVAAAKKAKKDPIVCQDVESTGSHMSDRVCMHQSEWDQQAADGAEGAYETNRHGSEHGILPH